MRRGWLSRLRWIAFASVLAIGAAGSAWATSVYDVTFTCAGTGCSSAAASLTFTLSGSKVSFSGSVFGQQLTKGALVALFGNPDLVTGVVDGAKGATLALMGVTTALDLKGEGKGESPPGIWFARSHGVSARGTFTVADPAIPEPSAALLFAVGIFVVGRRMRTPA